jgi:lipopolysaccharide transport system ATP-binding protein
MSDVAIRVEGLSKLYHLGARERYRTLRDTLTDTLMAPFRWGKSKGTSGEAESFWALKDISFEVKRGEVVGVIGRNGAGKSTLLKVLSRITEPTEGRVEIHGRIGSLLEVGTGFHPELTGRENIFLNGAILGMKKAETLRKFDEIVAFAEVEKFIDTPVKHYSSGMYVRLAFAVAAHLETEILIVDEVLAVGDMAFQKKCMGKLNDTARGGRTVLFVSHNMAAIRTLCTRAILLNRGALACDHSPAFATVNEYGSLAVESQEGWIRDRNVRKDSPLLFTSLDCRLLGDQPNHTLEIISEMRSHGAHRPAFIAFDILDHNGTPILQALPVAEGFIGPLPADKRITTSIELPPLIPGVYQVNSWMGPHYSETFDYIKSGITFTVLASPTPERSHPYSADHGFAVPHSTLTMEHMIEASQ